MLQQKHMVHNTNMYVRKYLLHHAGADGIKNDPHS